MSRIRFNTITTPSNPAASKVEIYASNDSTAIMRSVDTSGNVRSLSDIFNYSTTSQSVTNTTRTYITGSSIAIPATKLRIGTILKWKFNITKTAAGTATSTFDIAFGTAGTTDDTARVSFTKPVGTGVADEAWVEITAICRGPLSSSGVVVGEFTLIHNLEITGHATIPGVVVNTVSGAFDVTTPTYAGICITAGLNDSLTIQMVTAEAINL